MAAVSDGNWVISLTTGQMVLLAGGAPIPAGYVACNGATYDGTNVLYQQLWKKCGTRYGGTGVSSFLVPNLADGFDGSNLNAGTVPGSALTGYPNVAGQVYLGDGTFATVKDAQIDAAAAMAISKLASYPADATKYLRGDGTWPTFPTIPTVPRFVTGIIPAAGTTPTAGTGFTYTNSGAGVYTFTFTVAFTAVPLVLVSVDIQPGGANVEVVQLSSIATTGFIATGKLQGTGNLALPFSFLAMDVQ